MLSSKTSYANPFSSALAGPALVHDGVNTTPEIEPVYLWQELYKDFCRDSLAT